MSKDGTRKKMTYAEAGVDIKKEIKRDVSPLSASIVKHKKPGTE